MENKPTDNEIIKALECCNSIEQGYFGDIRKCDACPLIDEADCLNQVKILAFDLITRQKVEIERLTHNLEAMAVTMRNSAKATKTEAIKEVTSKIVKVICKNTYPSFDKDGKPVIVWKTDGYKEIDNIVKEKVGDANG